MRHPRHALVTAIAVLVATIGTPAAAAPAPAGLAAVNLGDWGNGGYVHAANDRGDVIGALNDDNANPQPVRWSRAGVPTGIGVDRGYPAGLNNRGDVVGDNWMWSDGRLRTLAAPARQMRSVDVNDRRQIVGNIDSTASDPGKMFLWQHGRFRTIRTPAGMLGFPISINNRGEVLGYVTNADWSMRQGFVWRAGRMTMLKPLGGGILQPRAINDRGQVIGYSSLSNSTALHPFLWRNGRMRDLMAGLPTQNGQAWDINNAGDVVGNQGSRATLWRGGRAIDLAVPGRNTDARRINERGDIAGSAFTGEVPQFRVFRWSHGRILFSAGIDVEASAEIAGIDKRGRIVGVIDDLVSPPRPVRWLAG
jgi:probable HAF family extracellular repeat protein